MKNFIKKIGTAALAVAAASLISGCVIVADVDSDDGDIRVSTLKSTNAKMDALYNTKRSYKGFDATMADLRGAIDARELTTFAVVNHAAGAQSVGRDLPATTLVIFGSPKAGTPLMAENRYMGMALPLKAMVWEEGGKIYVATTRIDTLASEHDLNDLGDLEDKIAGTLRDILEEATE